MKLVVDTNIVFSAILNPNGTISDLLLNSFSIFEFYSPTFIIDELENKNKKLLKVSGLKQSELNFLKRHILKKIDLIDINSFTTESWKEAFNLTKNIDEFDAPFVALCLNIKAKLWTGDKILLNGLRDKGVEWIVNTDYLKAIRNNL